jgi:hypothetical protein
MPADTRKALAAALLLETMVRNYGNGPHMWDRLDRQACADAAEAIRALAAPVPPAAHPPGWMLVPLEPTDEMKYAGQLNFDGGSRWMRVEGIYRAMLAAAPQEPVEAVPDAYLFSIRHPQPRPRVETFAAIDYETQPGMTLLSKVPLYAAPPIVAASTAPIGVPPPDSLGVPASPSGSTLQPPSSVSAAIPNANSWTALYVAHPDGTHSIAPSETIRAVAARLAAEATNG